MTADELMTRVRAKMTGDLKTDMSYLRDVAYDLQNEENAEELLQAVANYAYEIMPQKDREYMEELTFSGGKRMDMRFGDALRCVRENKMSEAEEILAGLSDKIAKHYENGEKKWFCFRNPFEYHTYRFYYPDDRDFDRAPFDFSHYLTLYGYVLFENHKTAEAIEAIERGIRFNPVAAEPRFELAEIYKFTSDSPRLIDQIRQTLPICVTPDRVARTLANMGFYCCTINELRDAAVFYFESLRFQSSRAVEADLQDVMRRMKLIGQKFTPPTRGQRVDAYDRYGLSQPPNSDLVNLAVTLARSAREYGRPELEAHFYRAAYDLTGDEGFKERMEAAAKDARESVNTSGGAKAEPENGGIS